MNDRFQIDIQCNEINIQKTIEVSKAAFIAGESECTMSHAEFLYQQSRNIKKFWWILQGVLLAFVCILLKNTETNFFIRRSLGLAGPLFVILIIPELWKNKAFDAMEIECTTFYTLRSVYAARLTLFAGVDMVLLSVFFAATSYFTRITLWEMLVQFLLPFNITCCICFRSLYSKRIQSEALSLLLCMIWAGLWFLITLNDTVYNAVSIPVWVSLLVASFSYMGYVLYQGQKNWQQTLEVKPLWN